MASSIKYIIKKCITDPIKDISDKAIEMAYGNMNIEFKPHRDIDKENVKGEIVKLEMTLDTMEKEHE
ncbi:MAG: hypothetical protein ACPLSJ_01495 [Thermosulfidibacteraceae bacterium]|jgi:signal transduction histidine kinase